MKKYYFVLTSVLALTACGWGGGGGHSGSGVAAPRAANVVGDVAASNSEITSMASAVVVSDDGSYHDVVASRSAKAPDKTSYAGYTVYKLDNVDFKLADTEDAAFNFEIDGNGRIVRAVGNGQTIDRDTTNTDMFKGKIFQLVAVSGSDEDLKTLIATDSTRQSDLDSARDVYLANKYHNGNVNAVTNEERATVKWNYLNQNWKFDTSGSDKGLMYSDFGYFTSTNVQKLEGVTIDGDGNVDGTDNGSNHSSVMVFAGGYDILPETVRPQKGTRYEGTAIGVIEASIDGTNHVAAKEAYGHNWGDSGHTFYNKDETAKLMTQSAYLKIDENGKTFISMPFGSDGVAKDVRLTGEAANVQWYDVEINDGVFTFKVPDGMTAEDITTRFSHDDDTSDRTAHKVTELVDDHYYGITTPEEATGTVVYEQDHTVSEGTTREFRFQGAYGMK